MQEAINAAKEETIIQVQNDFNVENTITLTNHIQLIGNGNTITFTKNGQIVVDKGSLTLGNGDSEQLLTFINNGNQICIVVKNGGKLVVNDGFEMQNNRSGYAITVGDDNSEEVSEYQGNGGTISGANINLAKNTGGNSYISGGIYTNELNDSWYGQVLNISGYLEEISDGTFTSKSGHRVIDVCGGTIDTISGGYINNDGGNGIYVRSGGHIGTIKGNVSVTSGKGNGYERGYAALYVGNWTDGKKTIIDYIEGGEFRGENYGLVLLGDTSTKIAEVGEISGGTFYGKTNGLNNNRFSKIGKITGGEFYGVEPTYRSEDYKDVDPAVLWGGAGMYNFGTIGSISNAKFYGGDQGAENANTIGSISNTTFESNKPGSQGLYNSAWFDYPVFYQYDNGKIWNIQYYQDANEAWYNGTIESLDNVTIIGVERGLVNDGGTIGSITNSIIAATDGVKSYTARNGSTYYSAGIFNSNNNIVSEIAKDENGNWVATKIEKRTGTIDTITNTVVNLDVDATYGMRNLGFIDTITNSAFRGAVAGVINDVNDDESGTIKIIQSGTYWGFGTKKSDDVFNEDVYGYLNKSENPTKIEPGLDATIGYGRYWGDTDAIAGIDKDNDGILDNIIYPDGYHMVARIESLYKSSDYVDENVQLFRYLKKPFTLSYDKNAANATGDMSSDTYTEKVDAEEIAVANNKFVYKGHYFRGWNTKRDGSGAWYLLQDNAALSRIAAGAGGDTTIVLPDNVVLYAQWRPYILSYSVNATDNVSGTMDSKAVDDEGNVKVSENGFSREGYTFIGWNTKADGTGTSYGAEDVLSLDSDAILYAQWKKNEVPEQSKKEDQNKPSNKEEKQKAVKKEEKTSVASEKASEETESSTPNTAYDDSTTMYGTLMATGLFGMFAALKNKKKKTSENN